ncbi:MAG TPA: glycoside hydrolase family 57 protein [Phycisphaerae bacterium]|nr:glycoside hydrolase family 57 protein [Phycisphaerae bacterium]HNU46510.1 glycoside hydrolase family 57 protein [Phycisphaerae bacterium]
MASVCFYFQVHQPYRLRRYSIFDTGHDYFDRVVNRNVCQKVAQKCYLPACSLLLDLVREHEGRFRFSFSITGVVLDQFQEYCPEVLELLHRLNETGCVEFLAETYYHSLAFLYSREELAQQVEMHRRRIRETFGQEPRVFRNTELIYNNDLAHFVANLGFAGMLCEGVDRLLGYRSPAYVYHPPRAPDFALLLKNYRLSDDIAFRFGDRNWSEWPLPAERFAQWVHQINGNGYLVNLFMDFETLGEHQWEDTGIFAFMRVLPGKIMELGGNDFLKVSEAIARYPKDGAYDVPHLISWADTERDLSAWLGNSMQSNAVAELYRLESAIKATGDAGLLSDWRRMQTSDHFYYMCTKYFADGDVHKYFNPYDSPYDSYINFMNVLDNLGYRARRTSQWVA